MPKRASTGQKRRRTLQNSRRTAEEKPRGKRPAFNQRVARKQRRGHEPRMRAGQ